LVVSKADKGNMLVIISEEEYNNKIENFINTNNFTKLPHDITNNNKIQSSRSAS
jgi:hypothetical protein